MSGNQEKTVCDYNKFRRPRYFHGMLLDDKDFLAEQAYHADKRRLLNRSLHGSGVVCGLELRAKCGGKGIELTPGLALDCCGNEIWVTETVNLDISKLLPPKDTCKPKTDCPDPATSNECKPYYLGIRFEEKGSDPVSVYLPGADCSERTCEYSRYKEGFCVEIVECCQEKSEPGLLKSFCECECEKPANPEEKKTSDCWDCEDLKGEGHEKEYCRCLRLAEFCECSVPCPECCSCGCNSCHVILGKIEVDDKGCICSICINECREYVVTWPMLKHLIISIFGGIEIPKMPDVAAMAANPILALCRGLRSYLVENQKYVERICGEVGKTANDQGTPSTDTTAPQAAKAATKASKATGPAQKKSAT
jgi:hypothetical protein